MNINYECESCKAIGELDEYYEFLDCPACGGTMHPLSTIEELTSEDFVAPTFSEDATISISREFIPKNHEGIKVASAVDVGFGGMLSASSATGKYSAVSIQSQVPEHTNEISSTGHKIAQAVVASSVGISTGQFPAAQVAQPAQAQVPQPARPAAPQVAQPVHNQSKHAPPPPPAARPPQAPVPEKPKKKVSKKKSFSLGKKSGIKSTATATTQNPPAMQGSSVKSGGKMLKKKGGKLKTRTMKKAPAESTQSVMHSAPTPQAPPAVTETNHFTEAEDAAQTQSAMPIQHAIHESNFVSHELESAALDQAAKFAALQAELDQERTARIEAEKSAEAERTRMAEMAKRERDAQAAKAKKEAEEQARIKLEKDREDAEREVRAKIAAEREAKEKLMKEIEAKVRKEEEEKEKIKAEQEKEKSEDKSNDKKEKDDESAKSTDTKNKESIADKKDVIDKGSSTDDKKEPLKKKKKNPLGPNKKGLKKKGMLPPPKGMGGMKKKTGLPKTKKKSIGEEKGDSVEEKKKMTPEEKIIDMEMTRIIAAKKKQVHIILAIAVVVICLVIIIGGKWLIQGFNNKKSVKKTNTTRVNMNTVRKKGDSSAPDRRPQAVKASSPLFKEYLKVKNAAKSMPQSNVKQIEDKIKLWQEFVDKNKATHEDDKYMKRSEELLKTLQDLKSMY